jgi:hypothetical protein
MQNDHFTAAIDTVTKNAELARAGELTTEQLTAAAIAAGELVAMLQLRAYPMTNPDDVAEQVHISVHGVDVMIRGRRNDSNDGNELYVNVDDERDDDDSKAMPLAVAVFDQEVYS